MSGDGTLDGGGDDLREKKPIVEEFMQYIHNCTIKKDFDSEWM